MNGLRGETKQKKNNNSIFTTETFGVVLILFSALCLVCVISRGAVFSLPGEYVCDFLVGLFGYSAIAILVSCFIFGFLLLLGKKLDISLKYKFVITVISFLTAILLHTISMQNYMERDCMLSYSEYLSKAYSLGNGGLKGSSCGGIVLSLVAYFFSSLLTNVGAYVVLAIALAIIIFFFMKDIYESNVRNGSVSNLKSSFVKKNIDIPNPDNLPERDYPVENIDFNDESNSSNQKLFVNNPDDFEFKSKREIKKDDIDIKLNHLSKGLTVSTANTASGMSLEMEKKINYIKTPAKINLDTSNIKNESNYGEVNSGINISKPISNYSSYNTPSENEYRVDLEEKVDSTIPLYEHDEIEHKDNAVSHAIEFSNRYVDIPEENESENITQPQDVSSTPIDEETLYSEEADRQKIEAIMEETNNPTLFDLEENEMASSNQDVVNQEPIDEPPVSNIKESSESLFNSDSQNESIAVNGYESRSITPRVSPINPIKQIDEPQEEKPKKVAPPINRRYNRPPLDLLDSHTSIINEQTENHGERMEIIKRTLEEFHINADPQSYVQGPAITRYEIKMPAGVSVKKVLSLDDDLRMRLASKNGIRIEAPIPGKDLVGIEVANKHKETVGLKEILEDCAKKKFDPNKLIFALGKNIVGESITDNLAKGPHYLVAGATGSGKSVCLNVMIISMLMRYSPEELRLILVDPKSVGFRIYEHLPHLMIDEIITEPQKALAMLQWAYVEMERRYKTFKECDQLIMDIEAYNERIASPTVAKMPRIVIIIDELADLMETCKKDMENKIRALAQKSRAAGIHLVLATQRPSVDIITGTIKANLPSRVALKVMNFADSNTILGEGGAEKLLGNGDMLYKNSSMAEYERYQGAWISDLEITNVVNYIIENNKAYFDDDLSEFLENSLHPKQDETAVSDAEQGEDSLETDDIFRRSLALGITLGTISISMIQRRFSVGFSRAGRIVDTMEKLKYIAPNEGNSKGRKVLITKEDFESKYGPMPE